MTFEILETFLMMIIYRLDSDVPLLYGNVEKNNHIKKTLPVKSKQKKLFIKRKKHLIAWLVSNCNTQSKREILIEDLKQYLAPNSVHIYGKCGTKKCLRDSHDARDDCWSMLERDNKFYLALENSICPDCAGSAGRCRLQENVSSPVIYQYVGLQEHVKLI